MNKTNTFRAVLLVSALYNFSAAAVFLFPHWLGETFQLPHAESPYYTLLLSFIIGLFGGVYFWMALQNKLHPSLLCVSAIGKAGVFGISFFCWYTDQLPLPAFIVSFGDLFFAVLFFRWMLFPDGIFTE